MTTLYDVGQAKLEKKMDFIKIINDITYLKLITKFYLKPSIETNFQIHHSSKSIIDLDQVCEENDLQESEPEKLQDMKHQNLKKLTRSKSLLNMNIIDQFLVQRAYEKIRIKKQNAGEFSHQSDSESSSSSKTQSDQSRNLQTEIGQQINRLTEQDLVHGDQNNIFFGKSE